MRWPRRSCRGAKDEQHDKIRRVEVHGAAAQGVGLFSPRRTYVGQRPGLVHEIVAVKYFTARVRYQLVQHYQRTGTTMRWKSPYGNVLAVSRPLGQHDLTEQEIYQTYTVPLMQKQAEIMGMTVELSPWQADGWVSMTLRVPEAAASR